MTIRYDVARVASAKPWAVVLRFPNGEISQTISEHDTEGDALAARKRYLAADKRRNPHATKVTGV